MIWADIIVIMVIGLGTPMSIVKATKEAQRTGLVSGLFAAIFAMFINIYIITRLWP